MKSIRLFTLVLAICFSLPYALFAQQDTLRASSFDMQQQVHRALRQIVDSTDYSLSDIQFEQEIRETTMRSKATFFGHKAVQTKAIFTSFGRLVFFEAIFPKGANISEHGKLSLIPDQVFATYPLDKLTDFDFERFSIDLESKEDRVRFANLELRTPIPLPVLELPGWDLKNIRASVKMIKHPTDEDKDEKRVGITGILDLPIGEIELTGKTSTEKEDFELRTEFGDFQFVKLVSLFADKLGINTSGIPDVLENLELKQTVFRFFPYKKKGYITGNSILGQIESQIRKQKVDGEEKYNFVSGFALPENCPFEKIHPSLSGLSKLKLNNLAMVWSGKKAKNTRLPLMLSMGSGNSDVEAGLNLLIGLDLSGIGLDRMLGMESLVLRTVIAKNKKDLFLDALLDMNLPVGPNAEFSQLIFRLMPDAKSFGVSILGLMEVNIDDKALPFTGGMEFQPATQKLNFQSRLNGKWEEPFGIKGLSLADVAMQMGASVAPGAALPNVALAGKMGIGSFNGEAAVAFDSRNPEKSMLKAKFNEVALFAVIDQFCRGKVMKKIPRDFKTMLNSFAIKDVDIHIAPQRTRILDITYEEGFKLGGKVNVLGVEGAAMMDLDYKKGAVMEAKMDPIDLGVFKFKGVGKSKNPKLLLDLRLGKSAKYEMNGMVELLGLKAMTDIEIIPTGFKFKIGGKVFSIFDADIEAKGAALGDANGFEIKAKMQNDLLNYFTKEAAKLIEKSTDGAVKSLRKAQGKVRDAQKDIQGAKKELKAAEKALDKKMEPIREELRKWQAKVNGGIAEVRKLQGEINAIQKKIDSKNEVYHIPEKGVLETEKLALIGLKEGAELALKGFRESLKFVEKKIITPNLDPRILAAKGGLALAEGGLKGAELGLEGLIKSLGFIGEVGSFIIEKGLPNVINMRSASFTGGLGSVSSGVVQLKTDLLFMGKKLKIDLKFDFNDPLSGVKGLVDKILD